MKVVNIVAIAKLNHPLDLPLIHSRIPGSSFPKNAHWLRMRLEDNTYIAFYKSGKFLITQKNPNNLEKIADKVVRRIKEIGVEVDVADITIHNIVMMDSVKLNTTLENLIANLDPKKGSFEPEQFPALVYKDWGLSFLLFSSGKVIITGAKNMEKAEEGVENFKKMISSFSF